MPSVPRNNDNRIATIFSFLILSVFVFLEAPAGIEPTTPGYKAGIIPFNHRALRRAYARYGGKIGHTPVMAKNYSMTTVSAAAVESAADADTVTPA